MYSTMENLVNTTTMEIQNSQSTNQIISAKYDQPELFKKDQLPLEKKIVQESQKIVETN